MEEGKVGVTREEVQWCFKHLLGRNLNDDSAIGHFLNTEPNFASLVRTIALSMEFQHNQLLSKRPAIGRDGFNYDDHPATRDRLVSILRRMPPKTALGFNKVRVGAQGDGGYVMLDDFVDIDAAYSLGINTDVTWDKAIATYGIDIYQYDHTIDVLPEQHERFHWFKKGIGSEKGEDFNTLPSLMCENGHEVAQNLLLKCDIEGHEWDMLAGMTSSQLGQFRQIVLETHGWNHMDLESFASGIEKSIENLTFGHSLIHVHANNCAAYSIMGGLPIPSVMEFTFVRNRSYRLAESDEVFPTMLDKPCDVNRADFYLGRFRF